MSYISQTSSRDAIPSFRFFRSHQLYAKSLTAVRKKNASDDTHADERLDWLKSLPVLKPYSIFFEVLIQYSIVFINLAQK